MILTVSFSAYVYTDGDDFQFGELSFTFSPSGSTEQTFQLDIVDDSFFEGREGLTLELRTDHPRVNLAPSKIEVLIVDNEGVLECVWPSCIQYSCFCLQ